MSAEIATISELRQWDMARLLGIKGCWTKTAVEILRALEWFDAGHLGPPPKIEGPSKPRIPEKSIEAAISTLLQLDGWRVFHVERIWSEVRKRQFGEEGMADLLCIRYCKYCDPPPSAEVMFIECKAEDGRLSTEQRIWHETERARGALTVIMGQDCGASTESWIEWYRASGLNWGKV